MPISKHFLKSFEQFITNYRLSGATSSYISWGKEQNHSAICDYFSELLSLIKSNQEVIHDASVIEYLTVPINLSTNTNRYLYECWNKFLIEYNSVAKMYNPINTIDSSTPMHLQIAVEGNSSERMMRDLKSALDSTQKAQEFSRKAYLSEVELLKKQIEELARENNQLSTENRTLKEQVHNDQTFRALQPQIETARHQLTSFTELLNTLYEITGSKTTIVAPVSTTALPSLSKEESLYNVTTPVISATTGTQRQTTITVSSPKITPLIPEKDTPSKQAVLSEPEDTMIIKPKIPKAPPEMPLPQKPAPLLSGDGFFNELSQELAKRKANKAAISSTAAVEKIEPIQKKNM